MFVVYYTYFNVAVQIVAVLIAFFLAARGTKESPAEAKKLGMLLLQAACALPIYGRIFGWW